MTQKYKLLVLMCWTFSMGITGWLGCPPGVKVPNARLYAVPNRSPTVYGITNQGDTPWHDVVITVNKQFQTVVSRIDANESFVLTPTQLFDASGKPAVEPLVINEVHVYTQTLQFSIKPDGIK